MSLPLSSIKTEFHLQVTSSIRTAADAFEKALIERLGSKKVRAGEFHRPAHTLLAVFWLADFRMSATEPRSTTIVYLARQDLRGPGRPASLQS
jgi:hypothetical protein